MEQKLVALICVLYVLVVSASIMCAAADEFIQDPKSIEATEGQNITFRCTYNGFVDFSITWVMELANSTLFSSTDNNDANRMRTLGIDFPQFVDSPYSNAEHESWITISANSVTNGSTVLCRVSTTRSLNASLMVLGPPSAPEPVLTAINNTLLNVSWPPPFTWPNHSITHYNITLTNTSDDSVQSWTSNETWFYVYGQEMERGCDVLVVNVTASSDIGESESGSISGGFPIGPEPFELMNCVLCQVTFNSEGNPMYTIRFQLPEICPYQMGRYEMWLFGENRSEGLSTTDYNASDIANPMTLSLESGMELNKTYTIAVTVMHSDHEGNVSASVTFSTELEVPTPFVEGTIARTDFPHTPVMIAGIVIGAVVIVIVFMLIVIIVYTYRRKRQMGVAEISLAKMFTEDFGRPPLAGGPYTKPESTIYDTIDGYQGEPIKKFDPSYIPHDLPALPPPRDGYIAAPIPVPQIMVNGENKDDSNLYLEIISDNGKCDPEVRSTGSGEYTTMKSVSLQKEQISAVNALALQNPLQGFRLNEDNYIELVEPGTTNC